VTNWVAATGRDVPRETTKLLSEYVDLLRAATTWQNLISARTIDAIWDRHIEDSAQLVRFVPRGSAWLDVGSGAGLPGIVIAIITGDPVTLCEPRTLRTDFLLAVKSALRLDNVTIIRGKVDKVNGEYDAITARAVAPATKLLGLCRHLTHPGTVFVLPKGRSAQTELDEVKQTWQGRFRLDPSVTSDEASILIASGVQPRGRK
jgi:16S rRNA (guanine527-N7)-methyltransferase